MEHINKDGRYGYCWCGCGQQTKIAWRSAAGKGWVRGEPLRFVKGHAGTPTRSFSFNEPFSEQALLDEVEARLWAKVRKLSNGCWEWTGQRIASGYGVISFRGKSRGTHRFAYYLTYGPIPEDHSVCHHCDNPSCINPAHLFAALPKDNTRDMIRKGRIAKGENHGGKKGAPMRTGARHWNAALTPEKAGRIKHLRWQYGYSTTSLVNEFGVSANTVLRVLNDEHWTCRSQD